MRYKPTGGYTLVELIVSVGLFALIMTLATGAYLMMISVSRQTQAMALGIDNLAFALETITRTIITSTTYSCNSGAPLAQTNCTGGTTFSVRNRQGNTVSFTRSGSGTITQTTSGVAVTLTDPSVNVTSLAFTVEGVTAGADDRQPMVIISTRGTVTYAAGKSIPFVVETAVTMRGSDI